MCSDCYQISNCPCRFCDFEDVINDEELQAKYQGCPDCGHAPLEFYNLEPWKSKDTQEPDFVEIVIEVVP